MSSRPEKRDTTGIVAHNCRTRQACALMGRLCRCRQQIQLCEERKPRSVWRSYPGPPGSYCFIVSITVCGWVESTEFSTAKLPTNFTNPRPKGGLYCIHYVIQSVFRRRNLPFALDAALSVSSHCDVRCTRSCSKPAGQATSPRQSRC